MTGFGESLPTANDWRAISAVPEIPGSQVGGGTKVKLPENWAPPSGLNTVPDAVYSPLRAQMVS